MTTNLYIVSRTLYGRHHYKPCMSFLRMLKRIVPHPLVEYIVIVQPASVQIREMWQLERDTIMYPPA